MRTTRDIILSNPRIMESGTYYGCDMLTGKQTMIRISNPRCHPQALTSECVLRADKCFVTGEEEYEANWIRIIDVSAGTRVKKSVWTCADIYSRNGATIEHHSCPQDIKLAIDNGYKTNVVVTTVKNDLIEPVTGVDSVIKKVQHFASQIKNPSYSVQYVLYAGGQCDRAARFTTEYGPLRGKAGEETVIENSISSDQRLAEFLSGVTDLYWAPAIGINMSALSVKNWLNTQILRASANQRHGATPYRMGEHILGQLTGGMYTPAAITIKRSPEDTTKHFLSEINLIGTKASAKTMKEVFIDELKRKNHWK